jgi:uncharacterized protein YqjF (DUF2071 family)
VVLGPAKPRSPSPPRDWRWEQLLEQVLFLHWAVPPQHVQRWLPPALTVDTCDGTAWISAVALHLWVRPRGLPYLPGLSHLTQLNLRTYVRQGDRAGVWFWRLFANHPVAVAAARCLTPLPYTYAAITYRPQTPPGVLRLHRGRTILEANCQVHPEESVVADRLACWLLERYCLFTGKDVLQIGEITHTPWRLCPVTVQLVQNHLGVPWGWPLSRSPDQVQWSPGLPAWFGPFRTPAVDE